MSRVTGDARHRARLRMLRSPAARGRSAAALFTGGDEIRVEAKLSITEGAVSGKDHVPSLPGEPPKADTHHLDTNIETTRTGPLAVQVESKAEYGLALEFGTSKMAERPYMRPATAKKRPRVIALVRAVVQGLMKGV